MNAKQLIIATAVLVATTSIFAGEVTQFTDQKPVVSTKTRADVQAEVSQARAQGLLPQERQWNYPAAAPARSTRTREEVRAEAVEAAKHYRRNLDYVGG